MVMATRDLAPALADAAELLAQQPANPERRRAVSELLTATQLFWDGTDTSAFSSSICHEVYLARGIAFEALKGRPEIVAIVATTEDLGIGNKGGMPWNEPADLKRFRRLTEDHTIIMGRKTYESIGRPLPRRRTIILSRQFIDVDGTDTAHSAEEALQLAATAGESQVFVVGGSEIYRLFLDHTERLERTLIPGQHICDTFFPYPPAAFGERVASSMSGDLLFESWIPRS